MDDLVFTTTNNFLHHGVKGMKWGIRRSRYELVGRQKNVTGMAEDENIERKGEGLGTGPVGTVKPNYVDNTHPGLSQNAYAERKAEYTQIVNDLDRYEKAFEYISDMDPKYHEQLFNRYRNQLLDLVYRHQRVMGYKDYGPINNASDMKKFFSYYHDARKAEGYI